jgi:hypothetical protein
MNKESIPAKIVNTAEEMDTVGPGGIFLWRLSEPGKTMGHIMLNCPGCGDSSAMHVRVQGMMKPAEGQSWELSYTPGITLSPSINCTGCCGWHGWLKNGLFTHC